MKPSTEKIAKPATKLVPLFRQHSMMQSLMAETGGEKREKRHHTYCKLLINPTSEATQDFHAHVVWRKETQWCKMCKWSRVQQDHTTKTGTSSPNHPANSLSPFLFFLPVAVIVIGIVTSQSGEAAQADGIGEEDLSSSIHPHLEEEQGRAWRAQAHSTMKNNIWTKRRKTFANTSL